MSLYVPAICNTTAKLAEGGCPVMQFIHGGAWFFGSNDQADPPLMLS